MVIDLILDRKDGDTYDAYTFYKDCMEYASIFGMKSINDITYAMDCLEEKDVKKALCDYIDEGEYNPAIKDYINSVNWLE